MLCPRRGPRIYGEAYELRQVESLSHCLPARRMLVRSEIQMQVSGVKVYVEFSHSSAISESLCCSSGLISVP
jgi:hypothetical protein